MNSLSKSTPYANLNPNLILDAIESIGIPCTSSLFALNSFENRVYQVGIDDAPPLIAKFYRPHRWTDEAILEEHQFSLELAEHEIPVVAPLILRGSSLHHYQDFRFALFTRQGGRSLELDNLDQLEWMGRFIGRFHAVGACNTFEHRLHLTVKTYGEVPYAFLVRENFLPATLKDAFCRILDSLLEKITRRFHEVGTIRSIRLHGDCHAGNVLWNDSGPQIVDLDDCLMGPAIQDMWMLLSGHDAEHIRMQLHRILQGYSEFYDFNYRELALIEPLRTLRMIHYAAWLAKRWEDPAFPLNFPWFNTYSYWKELLSDLEEQDMLLDEKAVEEDEED